MIEKLPPEFGAGAPYAIGVAAGVVLLFTVRYGCPAAARAVRALYAWLTKEPVPPEPGTARWMALEFVKLMRPDQDTNWTYDLEERKARRDTPNGPLTLNFYSSIPRYLASVHYHDAAHLFCSAEDAIVGDRALQRAAKALRKRLRDKAFADQRASRVAVMTAMTAGTGADPGPAAPGNPVVPAVTWSLLVSCGTDGRTERPLQSTTAPGAAAEAYAILRELPAGAGGILVEHHDGRGATTTRNVMSWVYDPTIRLPVLLTTRVTRGAGFDGPDVKWETSEGAGSHETAYLAYEGLRRSGGRTELGYPHGHAIYLTTGAPGGRFLVGMLRV